jgi:integrase
MAVVDLAGIHRVRAKGRVYIYAWRGGPRLKSPIGSLEFVQELAAAQASLQATDRAKVAGLIADWKRSDFWTLPPDQGGIAHTTRRNWVRWLDRIHAKFGSFSVRLFDHPEIRQEIKRWRDKWKRTPRAADMGKQVLSALLSYAVDEGRLKSNPCFGINNLYRSDRSEIIWTNADVERFAKTAPPEIMWALRLACLTGLRRSDLLKLSWSHVGELAIEMRTGKSNGQLVAVVPLYGELKAVLATIPKRAATVLTNTDGRPWKSGFGSSWNKAIKSAKEETLHFHDARGTAATKLFLAEFSEREIAAQLGWAEDRVQRIIDRYVRRDAILRDRIRRMDEARAQNTPGTNPVKPGVKPAI